MSEHVFLPLLLPLAFLAVIFVAMSALGYFTERRESKRRETPARMPGARAGMG
jgi:hypothetical protein